MFFAELPTWMLSQAHLRAHSILTAKLVAVGARVYDHRILDVLDRNPEPLSQVGIGTLTRLDRRDVTLTLTTLEEDGYVVRRPDPDDARRNVVELTPEGRERQRLLAALAADAQEDVLAPLDADARGAFLGALALLAGSRSLLGIEA